MTLRLHGRVAEDLLVHPVLDLGQLARADALVVAEVEAQPVRRHQAARLLDVGAQRLPQRRVQQVGAGVVAHRARAQVLVDLHAHLHARPRSRRSVTFTWCTYRPGTGRSRSKTSAAEPWAAMIAVVADLAAGRAVERRPVEDDLPVLALVEPGGELALAQDGEHGRLLEDEVLVADELRLALLQQAHVERVAGDGAHLARLPRALPLALELALEALAVHRAAPCPDASSSRKSRGRP